MTITKQQADTWESEVSYLWQVITQKNVGLAKKDAEIAELKTLSLTLWAERHSASEVDAIKAEVERLRGLLEESMSYTSCPSWSPSLTQEIKAALEQK